MRSAERVLVTRMSKILKISERSIEMDQLKLFQMIEDLSNAHYAKIIYKPNEVVQIHFYTRGVVDFVCKWKFDEYFFEKELKSLFTKHNSVTVMADKKGAIK